MAKQRRPKLADVAKRAGVSLSAASAALNDTEGSSRVSDATRLRIQQAADELEFKFDLTAKALATHQTRTVGFVSDGIAAGDFAGEQIAGSNRVARADGFAMFIIDTAEDSDDSSSAIETMLERRVDGIIFAAKVAKIIIPPEVLSHIPAVMLNCVAPYLANIPAVLADDVNGGHVATSMLASLGHTQIAFISGAAATTASLATSRRQAGFELALADNGISIPPHFIQAGDYEAAEARRIGTQLLAHESRPTAIVCVNDRTAFGIYQAACALGLRIPEDLSIVGFDDQHLSSYYDPPLTTIRLPHDEMGAAAMHTLQQMLGGEVVPSTPRLVTPVLIERGSCARPTV